MSNYIMLDGKKIEISEETAKNFRKEFFKIEPRHGDVVVNQHENIRIIVKIDGEYYSYGRGGYEQAKGQVLKDMYNHNHPTTAYTVKYNIFD